MESTHPAESAPAESDSRPAVRTGFVYHERYLAHDTGPEHPERPERLPAVLRGVEAAGLGERLVRIEPRTASLDLIAEVHDRDYIERVRRFCRQGGGYLDGRDTVVSGESDEAALLAAGGVLAAVDAVMDGRVRNAFCAVRPPGHHAMRDRAMGFCVFNNVAVAARYIRKKHKLSRVLIVDWDVHHGNGTQAATEHDPAVLFFSVHRFGGFYPGTGPAGEIGLDAGAGTVVNVPLPAGRGDEAFVKAFEDKLIPVADEFRPDFVLVSAGFDAHERDPLGGMEMTAAGYARLTEIVMGIAAKHCGGRLVSVLEGGYHLDALRECAEAHIRELAR